MTGAIITTTFIVLLLAWAEMMTRSKPEPRNRIEKALHGEFYYQGNKRFCRECGQCEEYNKMGKWVRVGIAKGAAACSLDHEEEEEAGTGYVFDPS